MRPYVSLLLFLICSVTAKAQIDLGLGAEVGFPLMFNKYVGNYNHALGSPGLRAIVMYQPREATFVPSVVLSVAPVQLPVVRIYGDNVLHMDFTAYSAMINGRFRKLMDKKEFLIGVGVGVSYLKSTGVGVTGKGFAFGNLIADSSQLINTATPVININAEYIFPISSEVPLYAGIGAQIQYAYFFDQNKSYRVDIVDNQFQYYSLQPKLYGHMVNPALFLNIYYRFGNRDNY